MPPSHPRGSEHVAVYQQPEAMVLDGAVDDETMHLLQDFVHTGGHIHDDTLVGDSGASDDSDVVKKGKKAPWYKRRSPWWMLSLTPLSAIAMASTIAPKLEIYGMLACSVHRPEYVINIDLRYLGVPYHPTHPTEGVTLPPSPPRETEIGAEVYFDGVPNSEENKCVKDPVVVAAVAELIFVLTTVMGVLSCFTTAWWGSYSDRKGRTRVLGISSFGLLINDIGFILVARYSSHLPGGYWWLLAGAMIEGICGGMSTGTGAAHAYVADTTNPHNRSRFFSIALGLMFVGIATGPVLGALLIRYTHLTLSVFYFATTVHFLYFLAVTFVIPEPVHKVDMETSISSHEGQTAEKNWWRKVFGFLTPLAVFAPVVVEGSKGRRRDYNLLLVALSSACTGAMLGGYAFKFQYAKLQFGWTTETLAYAITVIGVLRASILTILLPTALKFFKPAPPAIHLAESTANLNEPSTKPQPTPPSPKFDLVLAQFSLAWEAMAYVGMALLTSQGAFIAFACLGSFGSGFNPALQSVACALYARVGGTENGKLFGALAVVQAISSTIVGPALFGTLFIRTVAYYPQAILVLSAVIIALAATCMAMVRIPKEGHAVDLDLEDAEGHAREETLVETGRS